MIKVSASGIGMLLECPRCLWLYVNEGVKRPFGVFPSLPGGMDGLFKAYFDSYRGKDQLPPEIEGKVEGKLFADRAKLKQWREINFGRGGFHAQFEDLDIELGGAIDELLVNDRGEYIPFDFKTRGYPTKEDTHEHYRHQLDLYALLFEKNGLPVAGYGYLLFFWPQEYREGKATFATKLVRLKVDPQNGMKILQQVYQVAHGEKPAAHSECEYCLYREGAID